MIGVEASGSLANDHVVDKFKVSKRNKNEFRVGKQLLKRSDKASLSQDFILRIAPSLYFSIP